MAVADQPRPVKLQVNTSGAWKDVAYFDAGDKVVSDQVMAGAEQIAAAEGLQGTNTSYHRLLAAAQRGRV